MTAAETRWVVFDLDGTLVDSRADISASINYSLERVGAGRRDASEIATHIGRPLDAIFLDLIGDGDLARAKTASAEYRGHFFEHCADQSRLYDGVLDTLAALSKRYRLAVATTKQTFQAVRVVEMMGMKPYFVDVAGTDGFPAKPDPEILLRLLKRHGTDAKGALMVGDTTADIRAAQAAGMAVCAVTYGIGDETGLRAAGPDFAVDRFAAIMDVVDRLWEG